MTTPPSLRQHDPNVSAMLCRRQKKKKNTVFSLITVHNSISAQTSNSFSLKITASVLFVYFFIKAYVVGNHLNCINLLMAIQMSIHNIFFYKDKNSTEGGVAPAGAKVTGATIRMWLLNKFISFSAVLSWKTGLKKM